MMPLPEKYQWSFVALFAGVMSLLLLHRCSKPVSGPVTLPANDTEQIVVDPVKHIMRINKPGQKEETITLPDHVTTIDIHKDNSVKVTSPQFGFEERPFIGGVYSDQFRFVAGSDLLYFKKIDLGGGVGVNKDFDSLALFAKVSYNVWDNISIGLTVDHRKNVGLGITIRL